jgi:Zn-dependent metalloprotease
MSDADLSAAAAPSHVCPLCCFIIPSSVLRHYAGDSSLDPATRRQLRDTYLETERQRALREAFRVAAMRDPDRFGAERAAAPVPVQHLFDCKHRKSLPGTPVAKPTGGFKTVFDTTAKVVEFYKTVLGRNSVDDRGFDLASSLHYAKHYDNAFWNGQQMVYGDGDGKLFTEMYLSPDVIGHELTHGVTQNESALRYEGESGALNESISDVFGTVFNQWLNQWTVTEPKGWLVGAGIIAGAAQAKGFTCLRDMVAPSAQHCLSPQPENYSEIDPTADVHENSGVPNKAFALFARALGGQAWTTAIKTWYDTCTSRQLRTDATFTEFATMTVTSADKIGGAAAADACRNGWATVGVLGMPT